MRKVLISVLMLCGSLVFSNMSYAESFLGAYVGAAIPHDSDARDNSGIGFSGTISYNEGLAVGVKAGHWFEIIGLELDANGRFPTTDKFTVSGVDYDLNSDFTVFSLAAHALLRYPGEHIRP